MKSVELQKEIATATGVIAELEREKAESIREIEGEKLKNNKIKAENEEIETLLTLSEDESAEKYIENKELEDLITINAKIDIQNTRIRLLNENLENLFKRSK